MTEAALQLTTPTLHLAYLPGPENQLPLVLLHGWGADSGIFTDFASALAETQPVMLVDFPGFGGSDVWPQVDLDSLLNALSQQLPERFNLLGWSLGGMLATAFCARCPQRVNKLITLATNVCFVARDTWHSAMEKTTFAQFCQFFDRDPAACLKQFIGLEAQGDQQQRQLLKTLRPFAQAATNSNWNQALALLGELDNRRALAELPVPGLHLFGEQDVLVPAKAAANIAVLNRQQRVEVIANAGHSLQLSAAQQVIENVRQFLRVEPEEAQLNKKNVADSFSRAAASYDGAAALQRKVADRLLEKIPSGVAPQSILDVGCGTGYLSAGVRNKYPDAHLSALDFAPGMIAYAQTHRPVADRWLCADAEALPLANNSVDLVVSSLTYQWCESPGQWGAELDRVLTDGGVAVFSTFAPGTLAELRAAWQEVDDQVHVNRFIPVEQLQQQLESAGLQCELTVETLCPRYDDLKTLMRELKAIGAHNVNRGRPSALTGRQKLRALVDAYEPFRDDLGRLPATYQVVYGVVRK
ncbi:malonyl-ACP O-methyltransferase BioC [bacterium SCSIO 12696]|nr:malonyl-ACP O-methyltransferase BioC [bacterium SCSIO 12696]